MEIEGRTLGVIGLGKLGTKVSKLAQAFGMNVIAWSPNLTPEKCKEVGVTYVTKEELFATADIVTIHVVLSQRSRGLVGLRELARMKPTAYLVNTARGPIVDEGALLEALTQKKIAGAGVDVFSVEPLPVDHPFRKLDNMVLTPHLGYVTGDSFRNHYQQMVEGIDAWFKGEREAAAGVEHDRSKRRACAISVILRCERSEPRRMTAHGRQPLRGPRWQRPPQDDGSDSDSGLVLLTVRVTQAACCVVARLATSANPWRHDGCAGRQPSSRLALALEPPRTSVIIETRCSPANNRPSQAGTRIGGLAPTRVARAGSHSLTSAGSSSTML